MSQDTIAVLLVEDDPAYARLVEEMLSTAGGTYRIVHAATLASAMTSLDAQSFDAALLDLNLSDSDGLDTIRSFVGRAASVPVVVLTGCADQALATAALQSGAEDYILKPDADPASLERALRYAIERQRAGEAVRESERRYRYLFERNPHPMYVYDLESLRFVAVNDAAVRAYGFSRDEFLRMSILDIRPREDAERVRHTVRLGGGLSRTATWRHRRKDGSSFEALVTSHPLQFGGRTARLVMAEDVTERLAAERRLAFLGEASALLSTIDLESSLDAVGRSAVQVVCDAALILLASDDGRVAQVHLAHRDGDVQRGLEAIQQDLQSGRVPLPSAYIHVMQAGHSQIGHDLAGGEVVRYVPDRVRPLLTPDDRIRSVMVVPLARGSAVFGVLALFWILSERRFGERDRGVAEDLARRMVQAIENARLYRESRELFDADLTGNFVASLDGDLLACNRTFASMLQFDGVEAAHGVNAVHLFGGETMWREFVSRIERDRQLRQRELELHGTRGTRVQVLASATGLFDDRGTLARIRGQLYDLSTHKALEAQLSQSQKIEAIGRLAGGIAHDFNNLLMVISGQVEKLQEGLTSDHPLRRSVDSVAQAADRATGLTQQLLAFSRRQVLSPQVLNLNQVVRNVYGMLERVIGEDISCALSLAPEVESVKADPHRLEQALLNLAVNARDAMPGGGTLTLSTANADLDEAYGRQHVGAKPGHYVMLAVSDTGCGMDAATQARVFEPFFTTKEVGKGTGLGLAMVYGIVKQSGGYIWVYSEVGVGTTFKIYLPVVHERHEEAVASAPTGPAPRGTETILLVEDEDGVRELIEDILTAQGYRVLAASRGTEALQISEFVDGDIHLLVTDVVMPQMSGREVALRLAARRPKMRVLYLSGYTDDAISHHGIIEPGVAFLQKPFASADLARRIREVLGSPGA